jgi:hypothetical protein
MPHNSSHSHFSNLKLSHVLVEPENSLFSFFRKRANQSHLPYEGSALFVPICKGLANVSPHSSGLLHRFSSLSTLFTFLPSPTMHVPSLHHSRCGDRGPPLVVCCRFPPGWLLDAQRSQEKKTNKCSTTRSSAFSRLE